MNTTPESLAARAYASALRMRDGDTRIARTTMDTYAHLDAGSASPVPATPKTPAAQPTPAQAWDSVSFDALPAEIREAVKAGTAAQHGRNMLELEAESELARPGDVHRYLTDPAKYVRADGSVDKAAIRADLTNLTQERPELSRFGHAPGQQPFRPDDRRRTPQSTNVGSQHTPTNRTDVATVLQRMQEAMGVRFTQSKDSA